MRAVVANTLAVMVVNTRRKVGDFVKNVDTMELSGAVAIFRGVTMGNLSNQNIIQRDMLHSLKNVLPTE